VKKSAFPRALYRKGADAAEVHPYEINGRFEFRKFVVDRRGRNPVCKIIYNYHDLYSVSMIISKATTVKVRFEMPMSMQIDTRLKIIFVFSKKISLQIIIYFAYRTPDHH